MLVYAYILSLFHLVLSSEFRPEEYVNTLGGTDSRYDMSRGSTLPLVARPWGFNSWAPMTDDDPTWSGWWFHPSDRRYFGLRCTHQPSPWIGDYGQFRLVASITDDAHSGANQFSGYKPSTASWKPYYFKVSLLAYGNEFGFTNVEFTPTLHGGIMRVTFPKYEEVSYRGQMRRVAVVLNGGADSSLIDLGDGVNTPPTVKGVSRKSNGGINKNFGHHIVAEMYAGSTGTQIVAPVASDASNQMAWFDFDPLDADTEVITVRIATSFISDEQAFENLRQEVNAKVTFEDVYNDAKDEWRDVLSRVKINSISSSYSVNEQKEMNALFYTNLYRASLFPRQLTEMSSTNELIHWSPYDESGSVYPGELTTDSGFWDAYITVYPYLTLVNREKLGTMIQGWVNSYAEGGWLPKWASPGYRGSMVGTMGDVVLADAIVKEIPGFDKEKAFEAISKDAFNAPPANKEGVGRVCLPDYLKYGYLPRGSKTTQGTNCYECVSRTLNYMQSDYAIAQAALKLGHRAEANQLLERAYNYSLIFDFDSGYLRSKSIETLDWSVDFDPNYWGGDFTEASAWQFRFYVPHDPMGLADLYAQSGRNMCDVLEQMQTAPGVFRVGDYSSEIHEQIEMTENCWGQYAHNNQPSHHILYMYNAMDKDGVRGACASKGQYWLRKVQRELYNIRPAMYAGDEDNGEMAAYYILSTLGLFNLSPGSTDYLFGSPLYENVEVAIDPAKNAVLKIIAHNNSPQNPYIQAVFWNGEDISDSNGISYLKLAAGGTLEFYMGSSPYSK